jgi:hypothetical protein
MCERHGGIQPGAQRPDADTPVDAVRALAWNGPDDPGDWRAVTRTFRDGHAETWLTLNRAAALVDRMVQAPRPRQLQALINPVAAGCGLYAHIPSNNCC